MTHLGDDAVCSTAHGVDVRDEPGGTCADCGRTLDRCVVGVRVNIDSGQRLALCLGCLHTEAPGLPAAADVLETVIRTGLHSSGLACVANWISVLRVRDSRQAHVAAAHHLGLPADPVVVELGSTELNENEHEGSFDAQLVNGRPVVVLVDQGGFELAEYEPDEARDLARRLGELATLAEMAAAGILPTESPKGESEE